MLIKISHLTSSSRVLLCARNQVLGIQRWTEGSTHIDLTFQWEPLAPSSDNARESAIVGQKLWEPRGTGVSVLHGEMSRGCVKGDVGQGKPRVSLEPSCIIFPTLESSLLTFRRQSERLMSVHQPENTATCSSLITVRSLQSLNRGLWVPFL